MVKRRSFSIMLTFLGVFFITIGINILFFGVTVADVVEGVMAETLGFFSIFFSQYLEISILKKDVKKLSDTISALKPKSE